LHVLPGEGEGVARRDKLAHPAFARVADVPSLQFLLEEELLVAKAGRSPSSQVARSSYSAKKGRSERSGLRPWSS
jgi:hypothetical protein